MQLVNPPPPMVTDWRINFFLLKPIAYDEKQVSNTSQIYGGLM